MQWRCGRIAYFDTVQRRTAMTKATESGSNCIVRLSLCVWGPSASVDMKRDLSRIRRSGADPLVHLGDHPRLPPSLVPTGRVKI
jgi:hypothetical protein